MKQMKNGQAADGEQLFAELIKAAGSTAMVALHRLVSLALMHGMPAVCKQSLLIPLFNKGDPAICNNYRGIQLISMLRKVISLLLCRRLTAWAEGQPEGVSVEASDQPSTAAAATATAA